MPIVLVQNEVVADPEAHNWADVEGVQYHYPSKYQRFIQPGVEFVYYRGVHRVDGKRRPHGEYFGQGEIGSIWRDPENARRWYAEIVNYAPFAAAVPAKVDGENRERIAPNMWRDGVRELSADLYAEIVEEGLHSGAIQGQKAEVEITVPVQTDALIIATPPDPSSMGRAENAKEVGDWAEAAVLEWLKRSLPPTSQIVHRAAEGEKPGWDIDYVDENGNTVCVEVKGTRGASFDQVLLTANELSAAQHHRDNYSLVLVARCMTSRPTMQVIVDPASKLSSGEWTAEPLSYRVRFPRGRDVVGVSVEPASVNV